MSTPPDADPVEIARAQALARLAHAAREKNAGDDALRAAISAAADLGISTRNIATAVTAAGVPISHDTVARHIRDLRDSDPGRLYHVDGHAMSASALPSDAPTLRHGDRITITDWVRIPVDLTAYDPSQEDTSERTGHREQLVTREYEVSVNGKRPFVTQTYESPALDLVEIKHGGFIWVGDDLYRLVTDFSTETPRPRLSPVMPRPSKLTPRTAKPDTEETQP